MSLPVNHFDRAKPFYPLVVNYLVLFAGFNHLAAQAIAKRWRASSGLHTAANSPTIVDGVLKQIDASVEGRVQSEQRLAEIRAGFAKILGPLDLKSEFQGDHIKVDIDDLADDLADNALYLIPLLTRSAGNLLILAHEVSKDQPWHDSKPLWEFLRHCRNGAAHGGHFNIDVKKGEPRHLAEWGPFRIEAALNGTRLFKDDAGQGMLSPGDPIRLLWDIEQAYPSMTA